MHTKEFVSSAMGKVARRTRRGIAAVAMMILAALIYCQLGYAAESSLSGGADNQISKASLGGKAVSYAACNHSYSWVVVTKPTCTKAGERQWKCSKCGDTTRWDTVPPTGHTWVSKSKTKPTCTKDGKETFECSVCKEQKTETLTKLGHSYEWKIAVDATCEKSGERRYTCTRCGDVSRYDTIPLLGHKWELKSTVDSTCAKEGTKTYKCSRCAQTKTEAIAKKSHTFNTVTTLKPTCTESGESATKCTVCGYISDKQKISPLGHDFQYTNTVASTCVKAGSKNYKCSRCSATKSEALPLASHSYEWVVAVAATCEKAGERRYTCTQCKDVSRYDTVPVLGHDWKVTSTVDSTCAKEGTKTSKCSRCSKTKTETIAKKAHSYTTVTTAATCTKNGETAEKCKVCGYVKSSTPITMLGHDWQLTGTVASTCVKAGSKNYKCSRCSATNSEALPLASHSYEWVVAVAATCEKAGERRYTCTQCKDVSRYDTVPVLGHDYQLVNTVPATCVKAGSKNYKCSRCSATKSETIAMTSHSYEWVVAVEATCEKAGERRYTCTQCKDVSRYDTVPVLGHDWKVTSTVDSTCAKEGTKTSKCSRCSKTKTETIAKKSHAFVTVTTVQATCTTAGESATKCSKCGYISDTQKIAPLGHDYQLVNTVPATCVKAGSKNYKCTRCSATKSETIAMTSHSYEWVVAVEATCVEAGERRYTCKKCGNVTKYDTVPAPGHNWKTTSTVDSTCAKTGTKTYKCSRCLKTKTETIAKKSHTFATVTTVQATCTTAGESATKCSQCGYISDTQKIAPLGHDWKLTSTVDSTCAKAGTKTYKCSRCSNTRTETIAKKSHVYQWTTVTAPTEKTVGSEKYACKNCGTVSKTRELYLISFYANGGKGIPANQTKKQGVNLTISSTVPTKDGYTFMGWSAGANSTVILYKPGATCSLDQNLKLYAVWQSKNCTVKYDLNGGKGTLPAAVTVARGATVKVPYTNITRTGYWFLGWAESSTATAAQYKANSEVVANKEVKTLYAVWKIKTFTLSFDANGGTNPPANKTYNYGANAVVPSSKITREGYYFMGWNTDPASSVVLYKTGSQIIMKEAVKLYAVWKAKKCVVEFDVNGGTGKLPNTIISQYDKTVEIGKASVERSGYYFIGWSTDQNARKQEYNTGSKITLKNDVKLYAVWLPKKWNVTFDANGGNGKLPSNFIAETNIEHSIDKIQPARTHYYFLGWSTSQTATTPMYTSTSKITVSEDTVLYAVWKPETYTLTFDLNGGASGAPAPITAEYGKTITIPKATGIKYDGNYFLGWSTFSTERASAKDTDAKYKSGSTISLDKNTTLYAVWACKHKFTSMSSNDDNSHWAYCENCKTRFDSLPHKLTTFAVFSYDVSWNENLLGKHIKVCFADDSYETRCGYSTPNEAKYCHDCIQSWTYYYEREKVYEDGENPKDANAGTQYEFYYRFGVCPVCKTLVMEHTVVGALDKPEKPDYFAEAIKAIISFAPGNLGLVVNILSNGATAIDIINQTKEFDLKTKLSESADFTDLKLLNASDDRYWVAKGYLTKKVNDSTIYYDYFVPETTPRISDNLQYVVK